MIATPAYGEVFYAPYVHSVFALSKIAQRNKWEVTFESVSYAEISEARNYLLTRFFDKTDAKSIATLKKVPFDFHYRYTCGATGYRHKIVDWEAGALYWNVRRSNGSSWEPAFRNKFEDELPTKDLMFLMGTMHRFPDQWLIASLIYPPKQPPGQPRQGSLL